MSGLTVKTHHFKTNITDEFSVNRGLLTGKQIMIAATILIVFTTWYFTFLKELISKKLLWLYLMIGAIVEGVGFYFDPSIEFRLIRFVVYSFAFFVVLKIVSLFQEV